VSFLGKKILTDVAKRKRLQRERERERKDMNKDRKRKERMNKINEIERKKKRLMQKRTYQRRVRSFETPESGTEANCEPPCILIAPFPNKMRKHRTLQKLRNSLPKSPAMRVSTVVAYIGNFKSPKVNTLKKSSIIKTPGDSAEKSLGEAVIEGNRLSNKIKAL
jgi:hypothetical protein